MMAAVMGTFLVIILIIVMVLLCEDRKTGAGTCN